MKQSILQQSEAKAFVDWPQKDRRTPWKDVMMRARTNPGWSWMPCAPARKAK
ncbi:hypothetical protein [Endozoicomonas sp. SESOKO1]|uniref:hypothetical protein n=1 Tax=Endozoicomonas sp. SESOKO1 TaxID=2828742 RepID=UPI0021488D7F|nr:hypothetical protein [Endozoicomonas sp. SESOKO1]